MKKKKNLVLQKAKKIFHKLKFENNSHTYLVDNQKIPSTSSLVHKFYEQFDSEKVSFSISKGNKTKQKELLGLWESKRDVAATRGTDIHNFAEAFLDNRIETSMLKEHTLQKKAVMDFWNTLPPYLSAVFLELKMYHLQYMYAGTSDFGLEDSRDNSIWIGDYKTNEDLFKCYKGKKMKRPFQFLDDSPFNHYQIQLSFYQLLLEQEQLDLKISNRILVWLKPEGGYEIFHTEDFTKTLKIYLENEKRGTHTENTEHLF